MSQLRSNFDYLKHTTCKYDHQENDICEVCGESETVEHYIFNCDKYTSQRNDLKSKLNDLDINMDNILINDLLGLQNMTPHQQLNTHFSLNRLHIQH